MASRQYAWRFSTEDMDFSWSSGTRPRYASRAEGLDERFLNAVLEREALISKYPKGAPLVFKHFRQTPINSFPFLMVYGLVKNELII